MNTCEIPTPPLKGRTTEGRDLGYLLAPDTGFATWLRRGRNFFARQEFEQAIWAFRKALREKPLAEEAHFLLGCSYVARGAEGLPGDQTAWDDLAESAFHAAIAVGDHLPARFNLGILLTRLGRLDEARREWEHILTVSPRSRLGRLARQALARNMDADLLPRTVGITLDDLPRGSTGVLPDDPDATPGGSE